jgi:pimeloyl-ACP methyl ester carboxylesterase
VSLRLIHFSRRIAHLLSLSGMRIVGWLAFGGTVLLAASTPAGIPPSTTSTPASGDFAGLVEIGAGRKMYLECRGSGSPTVVLESGYRNDADIWSAQLEPGITTVFPQVAKFTRVCAYDRPGTFLDANHLGRSTPAPMPRTARDLVSVLHSLLQTAHAPGPYASDLLNRHPDWKNIKRSRRST